MKQLTSLVQHLAVRIENISNDPVAAPIANTRSAAGSVADQGAVRIGAKKNKKHWSEDQHLQGLDFALLEENVSVAVSSSRQRFTTLFFAEVVHLYSTLFVTSPRNYLAASPLSLRFLFLPLPTSSELSSPATPTSHRQLLHLSLHPRYPSVEPVSPTSIATLFVVTSLDQASLVSPSISSVILNSRAATTSSSATIFSNYFAKQPSSAKSLSLSKISLNTLF